MFNTNTKIYSSSIIYGDKWLTTVKIFCLSRDMVKLAWRYKACNLIEYKFINLVVQDTVVLVWIPVAFYKLFYKKKKLDC